MSWLRQQWWCSLYSDIEEKGIEFCWDCEENETTFLAVFRTLRICEENPLFRRSVTRASKHKIECPNNMTKTLENRNIQRVPAENPSVRLPHEKKCIAAEQFPYRQLQPETAGETNDGSLFCVDLLEKTDKPVLNSIMDDSEEANTSVEKLKSLEINIIYIGHGKPFPMEVFIRNER